MATTILCNEALASVYLGGAGSTRVRGWGGGSVEDSPGERARRRLSRAMKSPATVVSKRKKEKKNNP